MVLLRVVMRVLSVISQLVLVRLLTPADFGLVAGASAAYAILDGLTETSMTLVLVQMKSPERTHYDTAWTLVVMRGLLVGLIVWSIAPFMAAWLGDPRVEDIVHVLAIVPVIQGLESVGMVRLQRELKFGRIFFYQLTLKSAGFLVVLPLALLWRDYWALVVGGAVARIVAIPLSHILAPHKPRLSLRHAGGMIGFSKWLLVNNVLTMAENFVMPMSLGRTGNLRELGLYQVSYDLAALPASEIAAPIRRPLHAGYARVADDLAALRQQVLTGFGFLVMVMVPMSAGIAATAPYVVAVALGPQWTDAAPALALGAICALFDALGHFSGGIYMVRNAQRPYVGIMALCLALRLALVIPAVMWGGLNAGMAMMALSAIINATAWFHRLRPLLGMTWRDVARPTWRSFAAAAIMAAAVTAASLVWPESDAATIRIVQWIALSAWGAAVHIAAQYTLWVASGRPEGPESALIARVLTRLRPWRRTAVLPRP